MGMMSKIFGIGEVASTLAGSARGVAEVFVPNATRALELSHESAHLALAQYGAEFGILPQGRFDRFINGLNRLPRPFLAFGTLGLFIYAMIDPEGFSMRMKGLAFVPEPLWWLLGAIVAFYFGAREIHHYRAKPPSGEARGPIAPEAAPSNPALRDWMAASPEP